MLRRDGWTVNVKRVERIWRREGLKVPARQPKRARLWLNDGSCLRLRPERPDHVWSYDFVEHRTHNGRKYRMLNVIDEFTRECLAIRVARKLKALDVIDVLSDLFSLRGVPGHIRSDNGPEFIAKAVQDWIAAVGSTTAYIEPGSPWENGYCESFNAKLRDELLNGEVFYTLKEASVVIEQWRQALQQHPTALVARLPPACAGGRHLANGTEQLSAARSTRHRHATDDALTSNLGHRMGAGQSDFDAAATQTTAMDSREEAASWKQRKSAD